MKDGIYEVDFSESECDCEETELLIIVDNSIVSVTCAICDNEVPYIKIG